MEYKVLYEQRMRSPKLITYIRLVFGHAILYSPLFLFYLVLILSKDPQTKVNSIQTLISEVGIIFLVIYLPIELFIIYNWFKKSSLILIQIRYNGKINQIEFVEYYENQTEKSRVYDLSPLDYIELEYDEYDSSWLIRLVGVLTPNVLINGMKREITEKIADNIANLFNIPIKFKGPNYSYNQLTITPLERVEKPLKYPIFRDSGSSE